MLIVKKANIFGKHQNNRILISISNKNSGEMSTKGQLHVRQILVILAASMIICWEYNHLGKEKD